jgi:hypothetical protein
MKILVWATTFGADIWSLTRYLDETGKDDVKVVMKDPAAYRREGISSLFPLKTEIVPHRLWRSLGGERFFRPDVTILDNRVPLVAPSPKGFVLWHGFGWKGPDSRRELRWLQFQLRMAWGDPLRPNPSFRWQCFGHWDFEHRTSVSGFHRDNCRILGSASHDYLRTPLDRELLQPFYPFDVAGRKNILLAPTWHYGGIFSQWGDDGSLLKRFLSHASSLDANVILRLHDSFRLEKQTRSFLRGLAADHPNVVVKYKDLSPDNFLDLQAADVVITNFSSIANLFYATGRPTIHIWPVAGTDEKFTERSFTIFGVVKKEVESVRSIWKLSPEENGGLVATGFDELLRQTALALDDPSCCRERSRDFLAKYMLGADGKSCERIRGALGELCGEKK